MSAAARGAEVLTVMARAVVVMLAVAAVAAGCKGKLGGTDSAPLPSGATLVPSAELPPQKPVEKPAFDPPKMGPLSFSPIVKMADPSVVTIQTIGEEIEASPFFRGARRRETKGLGTGFVVDKDGTCLTNNHVVENADTIMIKLSDDHDYPGRIIGRDPPTDIAVVKIEAKDHPPFTPLSLGDSDTSEVGDWVVAIGNPFGLSHTVSAGIISAKGRTKSDVPLDPSGYYNFLQTDASINPGNSGGPLLNLVGQVVGINSAIRGGGAQGIGFAIPINMVRQLLPMLLRDGHVTRSAMGVRITDVRQLTPEQRASLNLPDEHGTVVETVAPGGAAARAGLAVGDVILSFEGEQVDRGDRLQWLASTYGVGKQATLRVSRGGKVFDIKVTLGQLDDAPPSPRR